MSTTASEYVVTEVTKLLGRSLEVLAEIKEDIEKINPERLGSMDEKLLTTLHDGFGKMNTSLTSYRLLTLIASISTKEDADEEESA